MKVDFLSGALPYAEKLGWHVLLLEPGWKVPFLSKRRGGKGVYDATSDPDRLRHMARLCPGGNIGAACGPDSGFVVLDVDPRNGGDVSIRALAAAGLPAQDAETVAGLMVEADLRGSDTHGVIRLPLYVRRIRAGGVNAKPNIRVVSDRPSAALIDCTWPL